MVTPPRAHDEIHASAPELAKSPAHREDGSAGDAITSMTTVVE
jgi:hypothetical protein